MSRRFILSRAGRVLKIFSRAGRAITLGRAGCAITLGRANPGGLLSRAGRANLQLPSFGRAGLELPI